MRLSRVGLLLSLSCAPVAHYHMPSSLRAYELLVTSTDSLSERLAEALAHRGFRVQRQVRGGSGPVAAVVYFTFRERDPAAVTWLHVRVADTRTGVIVGAASLVLEAFPAGASAHAAALVDSLVVSGEP